MSPIESLSRRQRRSGFTDRRGAVYQKPSGLVKIQHLSSRPSEAELQNMAEAARSESQTQFDCLWSNEKLKKQFMLSIRVSPVETSMLEWTLLLNGEPAPQQLWQKTSNDLQQILAMISTSSAATTLANQKQEEYVSWEEQCRTFDGADGLPIIELDRLHEIEAEMQDSALKGELSQVGITSVLNSITMAALTGRLSIDAKDRRADIFFLNGAPVHATSTMGDGMECMLRLAALDEGQFYFDPRVRTEEKTVDQSLDSIMLQGAKLADNTYFLREKGLASDSVLVRNQLLLTESEFEKRMSGGEPVDMTLLKALYLATDGKSTLKDVIRKVGLSRSQWVPLVANLFRCNVISILAPLSDKKLNMAPKTIDPEVLAALGHEFTDEQSGFFSYPALLYMIERESFRADADHPLALVIFEVGSSDQQAAVIRSRILSMVIEAKRRGDILGHYENGSYGLLMPDTKVATAVQMIKQLTQKILLKSTVLNVANSLQISFGIAALPDDADDMLMLLSAAEMAKTYSRNTRAPFVVACQMDSQESQSAPNY